MKIKYSLLLVLLFSKYTFSQLNGIYTIGGISPNYSSIGLAVSDLVSQGVSGPVTFNIRTGTYTEKIILPAITGSSLVNTITFQSEALDSSQVRWQNNSGLAADNYVLQLDGANFIRIKHLSLFRFTNAANGCRILVLQNGASNNTIEYSHLRGKTLTSSTSHELIYSTTSLDTANVFRFNKFTAGYYSAYLQGTSSTITENANFFFNNQIVSSLNGIYYTNVSNLRIENNYFNVTSSPVTISGGRLNAMIKNNRTIGSGGISVSSFTSTAGDSVQIFGNMINANSTSGIYLSQCPISYVIHNSVRAIAGTTLGAFYASNSTVHAYNNIFENAGSGYAMYLNSVSIDSDYNIFYTSNNTLLIRYGTTTYNSLNSWRNTLLQDDFSYQTKPGFISVSDLHLFSDIQASNHALNLNLVLDLDGNVRSSTPDIGADEFNQIDNNSGILSITNIPIRACAGITPVNVNLRNFGEQLLTSAQINWSVNGVLQTPFSWIGNLNPGDTALNVSIGNYNIVQNQNYTFKVWTKNPNGQFDSVPIDDTVNLGIIKTKMSGNYTIGGVTPDFSTWNLSLTDLNDRGVCGPVIFKVRDGMYNETMILTAVNGASYLNFITYESESLDSSKVVLYQTESSFSPNWIIYTSGQNASHFHFKHLTIRRTTDPFSSSNNLINFTNSENIRFSNCHFRGADPNSGIAMGFNYSTNVWVENCKIYRMVSGIQAVCNNTTPFDSVMVVANNRFEQLSGDNFFVNNCRDSLIVKGNVIINDTINVPDGVGSGARAISVGLCRGSIEISQNKISGRFDAGITIGSALGTATNPTKVNNNFICVGSASTNGAKGFSVQQSPYLDFEHNSIRMYNTPWSQWGQITRAAIYFTSMGGVTNMKFINNCIQVDSGQFVYEFLSNWSSIFSQFDHNNVHRSSPNYTQLTNSITGWPGSFNQNSISVNPLYSTREDLHVSNLSLKAGLSSGIVIDIDGSPRDLVPTIGADEFPFYSNDAGCIQTNLVSNCDSSQVFTRIVNYGTDTLVSVSLSWTLNSVLSGTINWTGSLAPQDTSSTLYLGSFYNTPGFNYVINAYCSNPNLSQDPQSLNDSSNFVFNFLLHDLNLGLDQVICGADSISLSPADTTYLSQYLWSNSDTVSNIIVNSPGLYICEAINDFGCLVSDSVQVFQGGLSIPDITWLSDSVFTNIPGNNQWFLNGNMINGANADYILIGSNSGDYFLTHLDSVGCLTYSDTITVSFVEVKELDENLFELFPNPADEKLFFQLKKSVLGCLTVFDSKGQIVFNSESVEGRITIDTSTLEDGIYHLKWSNSKTIFVRKFMVLHKR